MKKKIYILTTLIFTLALNLIACQAKPGEIRLENLKDEQGLYKYADLNWGSTPNEVEQHFGKALGEPEEFKDVTIYTIEEKLLGYDGVPARVICEFFDDKLYEIRFEFRAKDVGDVDLNTVFSSILEVLRDGYGDPDMESLSNHNAQFRMGSDSYRWRAFTENSFTSLSLLKSKQDNMLKTVAISLFDVSYSSIYENYINDL